MNAVQGQFDLIPTRLAMSAMRDNGYKNAAYALAELIDNSVQAGASLVEVLCKEKQQQVAQRVSRRIDQIAVLDNGSGMSENTLRMALQFGNGTRLNDRSGIGRFGMGLPNASISQCRLVEVWTWHEGPDNALYSYIDLDAVDTGELVEVPEPKARPLPAKWRHFAAMELGETGTLVVWSELDRCTWMRAKTIIEHSELLIGRMYRRFLRDERTKIRLAAFATGTADNPSLETWAQPNDPIYRMVPSSTPEPFSDRPMFDPFGDEHWEYRQVFQYNGGNHEVLARFTLATPEARERSESGQDAGQLPHGQHAKHNMGISIVRADREIELSSSLVDPSSPRERWWGIEVEFPPALDEIFGVTNNKQSARTLNEVLDTPIENLLDDDQTPSEFLEQLRSDGDPRYGLIRFAEVVRKNLSQLQRLTRLQREGKTRKRRFDGEAAEVRGTTATRTRQQEGHEGASDQDEALPEDERERQLEEAMVEEVGIPYGEAHDLAHEVVEGGLKYLFVDAPLDSPAFFSVTPRAGAIMLRLNTNHPVYEHLIELLDHDNTDPAEQRLANAREGLRLLLEAWARYEDEQPEGILRDAAMDARTDWGRVARRFFDT